MSVHQLTDGRWVVRYRKGCNPANPAGTKEYFGRGKDGEKAARARDADLKSGKVLTKMSPQFFELANEYIAACSIRMSPRGLADLCYKISHSIAPSFGGEEVLSLSHATFDTFVRERMTDGMTNATIIRELSVARAVLNWAVHRKLIAHSPFTGYRLPKNNSAPINVPTQAEFDAILANAAPHVVRVLLISFYTGLRPGRVELLSLTWDSVDLVAKTLTIVSADKGGIPLRTVPLHPTLLAHLTQWKMEDDLAGIRYLIHYRGRPIEHFRRSWSSAVQKAGITRTICPYSIRHKSISDMAAAGADIKTVAELVGHANPLMTLKVYQRTNSALKVAAIGLLGTTSNVVPVMENR